MLHEFLRPEQASQRRLYSDCLEEAFRDQETCDRHRLAIANELEIVRRSKGEVAANGLKRVVLLLEVLSGVRRIRFAGFAGGSILLHYPHQPLRIGKWQWPQQNRVHHTEDGNICAD